MLRGDGHPGRDLVAGLTVLGALSTGYLTHAAGLITAREHAVPGRLSGLSDAARGSRGNDSSVSRRLGIGFRGARHARRLGAGAAFSAGAVLGVRGLSTVGL